MKWWRPLLIFLLCATPSWAGFWSDFPGVGPGTVLNDVIIDNSTINSSTLNQPIINDPTYNGTSTYNPGTVVNYDPSTIINGPNGSVWNYDGIYNLKNLTIAVGGAITIPPGSVLNLPDGSVWNSSGLSTLNIQAGGVITIGGVPAGGACPANQFYIALSSALVPTCAPVTAIPGPVTINNATFTGNTTMPDGSVWSIGGISKTTPLNFATTINITGTGALTFNGTPVGGTCPADQWVYAISPTLQPVCSTPTGGGGGGTIPTPVSVANGGLGQGAAPSVGQILVANGPTSYVPVTMTGDATINSAGQITVNSVNGQTGPFQPLTSISVTAPTNPVNGQFWFDPTTLQTYVWYTDPTSSQWVAVVNLTGQTLNNPVLNNAVFTGTVSFPNGSIADSALAGSYSGTGACAPGLFVTGLNRNLPPTCNPAGVIVSATPPATPVDSQLWFNSTDLQTYLRYNDGSSTQWVPVVNLSGATLNNPTLTNPVFVGTLQFPDGSYYDVNGHEVMKNLGVGMVAYTDGANAGGGTVYGNSLAVNKSGWGSTTDLNGYWDSTGIENLYGAFAATFYAPVGRVGSDPDGPVGPEVAVETDPNNNALQNPFGEYFFQNRSDPRPPADPTWQAEGLQWMNGLAVHDDTWDPALGCHSNGTSFWQGDCAVVAQPDSHFSDVNYKIALANLATTANAQASYNLLTNGSYVTELTAYGPNYATVPAWANSAALDTSAPNGLRVGTSAGTGPLGIEVGGNIVATFNANGLVLPNNSSPSLYWTSATTPSASITSAGSSNLNILAGAHYSSGNQWVADAATAQQIAMYNAPAVNIGINSGLTVGSSFTPNWIASFTPTGLNIATGSLFIGGANQFQSGSFTPLFRCSGGDPAISVGSEIGNWWTSGHILFYYIQTFWNGATGGSGNAYVDGLPFNAVGTGGGQGGMEQQITDTNASSVRGSTRMIASIFNGEHIIHIFDGGSFGGDYLQPLPCANAYANSPSGMFITGWYAFQ